MQLEVTLKVRLHVNQETLDENNEKITDQGIANRLYVDVCRETVLSCLHEAVGVTEPEVLEVRRINPQ